MSRIYSNTRCVDGREYRHDPMPDDPYLETDIGQCTECDGEGCDRAAAEPITMDDLDDMAGDGYAEPFHVAIAKELAAIGALGMFIAATLLWSGIIGGSI